MTTPLQSMGMKLAVPYNHDPALVPALGAFGRDIGEIFVPPPPDLVGTFRPWTGPPADEYRRILPALIREARDLGIDVNMVMNVSYMPFAVHKKVAEYAKQAVDMGVRWFTPADLNLAVVLREACPSAGIVASTVADISSVTRARTWIRGVGVDRIVVPRLLNKRVSKLRAMASLGVDLEVIVNESCIPACPYYAAHSQALGGWKTTDQAESKCFEHNCRPIRARETWEHYKTDMVPASAFHLEGVVTHLKLAGRDTPTDSILREVARFTALESDASLQLGGYVEPADVWDQVDACDRNCEACGFCPEAFAAANPDHAASAAAWIGPDPGGVRSPPPPTEVSEDPPGGQVQLASFTGDRAAAIGLQVGGHLASIRITDVSYEADAVIVGLDGDGEAVTCCAAPRSEGGTAFLETENWRVWYRGSRLWPELQEALEDLGKRLESTP